MNPKAEVPEGSSARRVEIRLFYSSHPGLHGAGGLAAYVEIKVPKKWVKPSPTESPEPSPTPSEPVPTASPSPSPTGPVLVLTKTGEPKSLPETGDPSVVTWTVTVRNVGSAAYEGNLTVDDSIPDLWNLVPEQASADGPLGFTSIGVFYRSSDALTVEAALDGGKPAAATVKKMVGTSSCSITFQAGKTLVGQAETAGTPSTTIDDWEGQSLTDILLVPKSARRLTGSSRVVCFGQGRLEPGEQVVVTIEARRYGREADLKLNLAAAYWKDSFAFARAVTELEGIHSVIDDIDPIVPLGRPTARHMSAGIGEGLYGTEEADELTGTPRRDVLMGHYGNDVLHGRAGIDVISGDVGDDEIFGGGGGDGLIGGSGKDVVHGDDGNDVLVGGPDKDRLFGDAGKDRIEARDGERDVVNCGPGKDVAIVDKKDKVKGCEKVRRKV